MDLFKFNPTPTATTLTNGEMINGALSKIWVERYRDFGEFTIEAKLSSGLMDFLPEGTLISHIDTYEVGIVENHEIGEEVDSDPDLTITGRMFPSWLENRVIGVERARISSTVNDYTLAVDETYDQAVKLINDHIYTPADADDGLSDVNAFTNITDVLSNEERELRPGPLTDELMQILAIEDYGIRTIRRNTFGEVGSSTQTLFEVYKGQDLSDSIIFSWQHGDLESASYLFSGKKRKNAALVKGRYVWTIVDDPGVIDYDRRFMLVDADDIDGNLSAAPTGGALTTILNKMTTRGRQALRSQNRVTISQTDISDTSKNRYRRDYNLGDLVTLDGNFGQTAKMRVVEYAEIEDENGSSGHPTLSLPEESS